MSKWGKDDLMTAYFTAKAGTSGLEAKNLVRSTRGTVTIPTSDTVTAATASIEVNGKLLGATFTTANMEDTDSTLFTLTDEYGQVTYTSGTKAESTTFRAVVAGTTALWGTTKVIMTAEGTQSANRAVPYMLLTER